MTMLNESETENKPQATSPASERGQPQIFVTPRAFQQWWLILQHDFTLSPSSFLRIQVAGKGCDGFTYATGLTEKEETDLLIPITQTETVSGEEKTLCLLLDPFTAFYVQEATLDYIRDQETGNEGFWLFNHHQQEYQGKFWTQDPSKVPSLPNNGGLTSGPDEEPVN